MEHVYDALQGASNVYTFIMENDRVHVVDTRFKPGVKAAMHSHPDHVMYIVSGGKLKVTPLEGKPQELDLKTGQVLWMDATSHTA